MNLEIMSSAKMSLIKLGCLVDYENRSEIELTVLVPNGLTINMSVSPEIKLSEIKEDVFEIAQDLPLFGALHDLHVYAFTCVNLTTSEQEELDEDRRLSDVKPFLQILRLVEREGDMASKQLNAQIGLLIGKGLHEFDALKNSEINDFRWRARLHSEEIQEERYKGSWIEKVNYKHPLRVEESTELPCYLKNILTSEEIEIELQFENFELFCRLSQQLNQDNQNGSFDCFDSQVAKLFQNSQTTRLSYLTCVDEIVLMAIKLFNCDQSDPDQLMLKVCGKDEYLLGSHPLMQYKYIRECIANYRTPSLIVVSKDSISVESKISVKNQEEFRFRSSTGHGYSTTRRRSNPISSMCLTEKYGFTVCEALKINHCDDVQLAIQVGLYHGGQPLTHSISTPNQIIENGQCVWNETLTLDIAVGDIPRMARLCFVIYQVIIRARKGSRGKFFRSNINCEITMNPLRWANTSVFDYKGQLRTGSLTLPMWNYPDGYEQEDMLNPLGTVMPNPNTDETTCLTITFKKYNQSENHLIVYPHLDTILSMESISIPVESSRNGHRSRAGSITSTMSTSSTDHRSSSRNLDMIREICCRDPLTPMVSKDREFLWYFRDDCCQYFPSSLPHLIACVKWNDRREVIELIKMLHQWPIIEPRKALELLDYAYADCHVRTYAIKCLKSLSDEDLSLYLLQLVQALKNESYLYCDLALFLLERALKNRNIGHHFFWLLRSEMSEPSISTYFGLILEAYCRGAIEHMKDLVKQVDANNYLKHMNEIVKREFINKTRDSKDRLAVTMQEILDLDYYKEYFQDFINPLNPSVKLKNIRTDRCRLMDSKMKPLWLVFSNEDARAEDVSIIFKSGDDLRQDMLTVQMIRIMDKLWKDEGLDLRMEPYGVIATEKQVGLIEVVTNTQTLARIQKSHSMRATSAFNKASLLNWLKCNNPDQESLSKAINQFTLSCAGYCVATYVLGVADRHSDNILVKTNGQILHIDFGHILGKFKEKFGIRRERVPFVLTNDFVYVITAGNTQNGNFHEFQNYCEQAFTILRKKGSFILSLFAMMLSSGIPELSSIEDLDYLRETLVLDLNDEEALKHFRCKFEEALKNSWKTSINMMAHNISRTNKNQ